LETEVITDLKMRFPNADYQQTKARWDWQVEEGAQEGQYRVRMRLGALQASMVSLTVRLRYDSEAEQKPTENKRLLSYREVFSGYKGQEYVAVVDGSGAVLALEEEGEALAAAMRGEVGNAMLGGYQAGSFFSASRLREYAYWAVWQWPEGVGREVGASWGRMKVVEPPRTGALMAEVGYAVTAVPEAGPVEATISAKLVEGAEVPEWARRRQLGAEAWTVLGLPKGTGKLSYGGEGMVEMHEEMLVEVEMSGAPSRRNEQGERVNRMFYVIKETFSPAVPGGSGGGEER
jgi:hypothetical protein